MKIKFKLMLTFFAVIAISMLISIIPIKELAKSNIENAYFKSNMDTGGLLMGMFDEGNYGEWRVVSGKLFKGNLLINNNTDLLDSFKKVSNSTNQYTFFATDTRVSTSLKDKNGKYIVGTKATQEVIDHVIKKGKPYQTIVKLPDGKTYVSVYLPLKNKKAEVVGMFFVGLNFDVVQNEMAGLERLALLVGIIAIAVAILIAYFVSKDFIRVIYKANDHLINISKADLTQIVDDKNVKRKDEFGNIFSNINEMQGSIKQIINKVMVEAENINNRVNESNENISMLNSTVADVSATTQQLSASMEETAASTELMQNTSENIENAASHIALKAKDGAIKANEIIKRAEKLKEDAVESRKNASEVYSSVNTKLKGAIEKSSSVNEIGALSDAILNITSKTNLLALNASIEAARAGEAGRGFSVVAEEIRKLAEDSTNTVNEIQNITQIVLESVNNLIESSNEVLNFINTKVVDDYDTLVKTGEQYSTDASEINEMVNEFSKTSDGLLIEMKEMVNAIKEVATANGEAATETETISEKAQVVTEKTQDIYGKSLKIKESAEKLVNEVKIFKI